MSITKHFSLSLTALLLVGQLTLAAESDQRLTDIFQSAIDISNQQQQQILLYRQQLEALEIELGGFDPRLLEPLQGLGNALIEARYYDEADQVLSRQMQLLRTIDGPSTVAQLPILDTLIENDVRRQDWESVADRFEYIYWIQSQKTEVDPIDLVSAKNEVLRWYLATVYLEAPSSRALNFSKIQELQRDRVDLAEQSFAEDSIANIPWLYEDALYQFQIYSALTAEDELGFDARESFPQLRSLRQEIEYETYPISGVFDFKRLKFLVEEKERLIENFMRKGVSQLEQISTIASKQGNLELEAMAMIYKADYESMIRFRNASKQYLEAMDKLREAGVASEKISAFFSRPVVLPVPHFHETIDSALAYHDAAGYRIELNSDAEQESQSVHLGDFFAWSTSLAHTPRPQPPIQIEKILDPQNVVDLNFSISSVGRSRNPKVFGSQPDTSRLRRIARDAVKAMHFRPRFVDGKRIPIDDVTLRFISPTSS